MCTLLVLPQYLILPIILAQTNKPGHAPLLYFPSYHSAQEEVANHFWWNFCSLLAQEDKGKYSFQPFYVRTPGRNWKDRNTGGRMQPEAFQYAGVEDKPREEFKNNSFRVQKWQWSLWVSELVPLMVTTMMTIITPRLVKRLALYTHQRFLFLSSALPLKAPAQAWALVWNFISKLSPTHLWALPGGGWTPAHGEREVVQRRAGASEEDEQEFAA